MKYQLAGRVRESHLLSPSKTASLCHFTRTLSTTEDIFLVIMIWRETHLAFTLASSTLLDLDLKTLTSPSFLPPAPPESPPLQFLHGVRIRQFSGCRAAVTRILCVSSRRGASRPLRFVAGRYAAILASSLARHAAVHRVLSGSSPIVSHLLSSPI
ncbi:hypothetical protein PIB30_096130 [Stylosanthes scabra]|uniref:Uncharacterized protein n=1 Tax=Stylosanthes scabra TaxID=79078 RepID=A0ABU6TYE0_9FABA|nr:hypothetical protein [Stylosanthes scabra]